MGKVGGDIFSKIYPCCSKQWHTKINMQTKIPKQVKDNARDKPETANHRAKNKHIKLTSHSYHLHPTQVQQSSSQESTVHHTGNSNAPSSTSVQKLGNTRAGMLEAESLPIRPEHSDTIASDLQRRQSKSLSCRHNRLARIGIFTLVLSTKINKVPSH